jgi:hypothetical protein
MRLKPILIAVVVIAVSFFISLKAIDWLAPRGGPAPVLVELPPLPAVPRTSNIIAPVAITLVAIRAGATGCTGWRSSGTGKTSRCRRIFWPK